MSGAAAAAPEPLVLVVPNFSEGRRAEVMDAIVAAMTSVPGITLLNRQSDPDHNRLDTTLIGSPEAARAAAMAGAQDINCPNCSATQPISTARR